MRVSAAGQLGVGSVGAAGGLDRMRVGPAGGTGAGSSRCGWEDWGWFQSVQLGRLGVVSVGAAGKTEDGVGWSSWRTGMMLVGAAGEGK